jgi:hypothetical protein
MVPTFGLDRRSCDYAIAAQTYLRWLIGVGNTVSLRLIRRARERPWSGAGLELPLRCKVDGTPPLLPLFSSTQRRAHFAGGTGTKRLAYSLAGRRREARLVLTPLNAQSAAEIAIRLHNPPFAIELRRPQHSPALGARRRVGRSGFRDRRNDSSVTAAVRPDGLRLIFEDPFDGPTLAPEVWVPHYFPSACRISLLDRDFADVEHTAHRALPGQ